MTMCSACLIVNGDPTEWTGLPAAMAKVSLFKSRFHQPGTEAVDAFTQNWDRENNWNLPPVSQISRVIAHAGACKAVGTLVCCHSYVEVIIFLVVIM